MKRQPSRLLRAAQCFTLVITLACKVVGLGYAVQQLVQLILTGQPTPATLAFAAFMIAGGQVSEGLILTVLDRVLGSAKAKPPESGR